MRNSQNYLFTRSKSKYIKYYDLDTFDERLYENEEEITSMCLFKDCVFICDVKNDIR